MKRKIIFTKFGMENFKKYQDKIEFEIKEKKIVLISGQNGSGKSTIFDALFFTLFGCTAKGLRSSNVVNEKSKKNCHTWLEFVEIKNQEEKNEYRIDRFVSHSKLGNTVALQKNNKKIGVGQKEVNPLIEKIILPKKFIFKYYFFPTKNKKFLHKYF